jgi:midasin
MAANFKFVNYNDSNLYFAMQVSVVTHVLANVLTSLYSKGFGISAEDQVDDATRDKDANGTGMGEGAGMNDVSDQITDEDQLLGALEKVQY